MAQPQPRWTTAAELGQVDVPPGGTTDQVLAKNSNADRDLKWADAGGGGGGSFLSDNTARVDPSGNDGTGTVGDLTKPFLTVQAALDAILVNETDVDTFGGVILFPAVTLSEELIMTIGSGAAGTYAISFIGQRGPPSYSFGMFDTLTINKATDTLPTLELFIENGTSAGITSNDIPQAFIFLRNFDFNTSSLEFHGTGTEYVTFGSFDNSAGNIDTIDVEGLALITLFGLWAKDGGTTINSDGNVSLAHCKSRPDYDTYSGFTVDDGTGTGASISVTALDSLLGDVTAFSTTCRDSRILGSVTSEGDPAVTYEDVFLKGVPPGGSTADRLEKASGTDFDTTWVTPA